MSTPFSLNDLPHISPWPARLLGLEPWEQKRKTSEEVVREYEYEKWGPLLARVQKAAREVSVEEVDRWTFEGTSTVLCSIEDRLELVSAMEAHQQYLALVETVLKSFLPASAIVELGAGYGSVILALAKREPFAQMRIMAGEYTPSGIELVKRLADAQHLQVEVDHCDFASRQVTGLAIPQDALIFTSYAVPYVPLLLTDFVKALIAFRPRAIVHFEPCYEHCDKNTLLGLMRRRYIEVNDYNTNLVTLLHDQQAQGLISILEERPAVFGTNPLLVASMLVWHPTFDKDTTGSGLAL